VVAAVAASALGEGHLSCYYQSTDTSDDIVIHNADYRDILPGWLPGIAAAVITDPPYGYNYRSDVAGGIANDSPEDFEVVRRSFDEVARILIPGAPAVYFCSGSKPTVTAKWIMSMAAVLQFDEQIVWEKPGLGFGYRFRRTYDTILVAYQPGAKPRWYGGHSQRNIMSYPRIMPRLGGHPTPKPLKLVEDLLLLFTRPGDLIVDPFMGEGTTLIAAKRLGRRAIGIEIEERWCERAAARLEDTPCHVADV